MQLTFPSDKSSFFSRASALTFILKDFAQYFEIYFELGRPVSALPDFVLIDKLSGVFCYFMMPFPLIRQSKEYRN